MLAERTASRNVLVLLYFNFIYGARTKSDSTLFASTLTVRAPLSPPVLTLHLNPGLTFVP